LMRDSIAAHRVFEIRRARAKLREMAGLLTEGSGLSDPEVEQLAERMTGKTTNPLSVG
jgi:hypothetical protein